MKTCARKWQVEATRDGRLRGKDLESAERHRETCRECAQQARELETLSNALAHLPALGRDPVSVQRTRQQLLSAFNQAVIEPVVSRALARALLAFAGAALLLSSLWVVGAHRTTRPASAPDATSVVQVEASPDAHWTEHLDERLDRIVFAAGSASFRVRAHPGRRVIVSLPDGEIEDLGTIFAVLVQDQTTKRVTVSEGRVSLQLRGHAPIIIGSGESWEAEAPPAESAELAPRAASAPSSSAARNLRAAATSRVQGRARPAKAAGSEATVAPSLPDAGSARAEDDDYLRIIALLRAGKQDDARAEAKRYLLHFPNGFRRVEVLNIATR